MTDPHTDHHTDHRTGPHTNPRTDPRADPHTNPRTDTHTAPRTTTPQTPPARLQPLDTLRGFALLGILLVNALVMSSSYASYGGPPNAPLPDRTASWLITALATTKFYLLFSFLFGYSFALQQRSAARATATHHLRRTATLFTIGLAHALLLYPGDILTTYAALALPLYACRNMTPTRATRTAVVLVTTLAALFLLAGVLTLTTTAPTPPQPSPLTLPTALASNLLYAPDIFAAFLIGLAAAKSRVLDGISPAILRRTLLRTAPLGLTGAAVTALCANGPFLDARWFLIGHAAALLTAPALTTAYACALLLLTQKRPALAHPLAAAGRLALTHYLTQSLVLAALFTWLDLRDKITAAPLVAGCLLLYAAQLAVSTRHSTERGPAERLLRAATSRSRPSTSAPPAR